MAPFASDDEFFDQTYESLDLRSETIEAKQFNNCVFVDCVLAEATLVRCRFVDCTFKKCDLSNARVTGSVFRDLHAEGSKFIGVNWTEATSVDHLDFNGSVLNYSNFIGLDLRKSRFKECVARDVEFAQAKLMEADLRGTDFAGSTFNGTNLTKADLRSAINYTIRPVDNVIKKAKFSLPEATALLYGLDIVLED